MKKKIIIALGLIGIICIVLAASVVIIRYKNYPPDSQIFINGRIYTMNKQNSIVEAVAVKKDKIIAIGTTVEIKKLATAKSKIIDLQGRTMIPGLVDAHSHFPGSGMTAAGVIDLYPPPFGKITSISLLLDEIRKKAAETKKGKWIVGFGYDDTYLKEKRHPDKNDLDAVSPDNPVFVMHISGHYSVVNSTALKELGITDATRDPEGGKIHRKRGTREPNGILEETARELAYKKAMHFSYTDQYAIIQKAADEYISNGYTTVQNGKTDKMMLTGLSLISKLELIPVRIVVWPAPQIADTFIADTARAEKYNTDRFKIGAVKLLADGSIQAYTAYLTKPYYKPYEGNAAWRGYPRQPVQKLKELVKRYHDAGMQIAIHANGDAAIDDVLDAFESAQKANPKKDIRHLLVHGNATRPDQLDRMKKISVSPTFLEMHPFFWGDRHRTIFLGPVRAEQVSPAGTAYKKGILFSIHLDSPVVPVVPFVLIHTAVNRETLSGAVLGLDEKIPVMEALRAITINAAWQMNLEDKVGSIEKGKFADFIIVSDDPLANPSKIREIKVLNTIIGGVLVYNKNDR